MMKNNLNLILETRDSILDGITLFEPVDESILDKLINSTLLKEVFNNKILGKIYTNEKTQLMKYRELVKDGYASVKYSRSDGMIYGRCNPVRGLGEYQLRREIRQTLLDDVMEDVDIDNCHPVMLEQVMTHNNIACPMLQSYIKNREKWFNIVREFYKIAEMEIVKANHHLLKDIPKNLFIRILFSGGVAKWKTDHNITVEGTPDALKAFEKEIKGLCKIVCDANPELAKMVVAKKERSNLNGSVCSYFLQEKEVIILEQVFKYCASNGYIKDNVCVLCADGIMLQKSLYNAGLLKELEVMILNTTGFKVSMSNKAMDQGYNSILDKNLKFNLYSSTFSTGLLADHFKTIYSNKFIVVGNELYEYNGVFWVKEKCKKNSSLHSFVDTVYYKYLMGYISREIAEHQLKVSAAIGSELEKMKVEQEPMIAFLQNVNSNLRSVKKRRDIVEDIIIKLTCNTIEFDTNPHLLAFTNRVYDWSIGKFVEPKYSQYVTMTTGWSWCDYYSDERLTEFDALLNTIFPNEAVKEYYLETLSTGLYGQQIEKLFIATGGGGNGKGLLNSLMMATVGEYGYKLPNTVLLQPIKEGANPAIANMNKKRFCLAAEPDDKQRICASTMKELTGDASINCRTLYSTDTKTNLHLTLMLECNAMPKLDEVNDAIQRRIVVVPFVMKFVDETVWNAHDEASRVANNMVLGNSYYKTDEFRIKYIQALMVVLMRKFDGFRERGYKFSTLPDACRDKSQSYLATSDDVYSWFIENYERVDDDTSFVYLDDVYSSFTCSTYYTNMNKKDKREMNKANFSAKFGSSLYLRPFVRERKVRYAGMQHSKPFVINFKMIEEDSGVSPGYQNPLDANTM